MRITETAYAKINIALDVTGTSGGMHELDMVMQTVGLADDLLMEESEKLSLEVEGADPCPGDPDGNLVLRAARLLAREAGVEPRARIVLRKRIPTQAGYGGGSSDCAAALRGLAKLWKLSVPREDALRIALALGSDVPYFLTGGCARVGGTGGKVEQLPPLPRLGCLLLTPRPGLDTGRVYRAYDEMGAFPPRSDIPGALEKLRKGDLAGAFALTRNALEAPACLLAPRVESALSELRASGSPFVRMSGSGTGVYALFPDGESALRASGLFPGAAAAPFTAGCPGNFSAQARVQTFE